MKYLFILTLVVSNVVHATDIITISPDRYSFNVTQTTVTIMQPEITKTASLADCIYEREHEFNMSYEDALSECTEEK